MTAEGRTSQVWRFVVAASLIVALTATQVAAAHGSLLRVRGYPKVYRISSLSSVSCVSKRWCMAVGSTTTSVLKSPTASEQGQPEPLVELWNGSRWRKVAAWTFTNDPAASVFCVTWQFCVAVGTVPYIHVWNGVTWQLDWSDPDIYNGSLAGVSCTSTTRCVAVGELAFGGMIVVTLDGSNWSIRTSTVFGSKSGLYGVSCASGRLCEAIGTSGTAPIAVAISPRDLSRQATPSQSNGTVLGSVYCFGPSNCVAVGRAGRIPRWHSLADRFSGKTWTESIVPGPRGYFDADNAVACVRDGSCLAVGWRTPSSEDTSPLPAAQIMSSTGTWNASAPLSIPQAYFTDDSCVSAKWCMAVGLQNRVVGLVGNRTFAEVENEGVWRLVSTPN